MFRLNCKEIITTAISKEPAIMLLLKVSSFLFSFSIICESRQPNIIFIVADDLGWNDVSFHGSKQIPTPNIDVLAYDGIIFNNYYVSPLCTPSRGSLMTGKYPLNLGLQHGVIRADEPWGLSLEEKILPQYLKELGYATHGLGKWHLGFFEKEYLPTRRGFDSFFGSWTGYVDYYTHIHNMSTTGLAGYDFHDHEDVASKKNDGAYATELYTKMAKSIIRKHNYTQPLFLYLSHQAVHTANAVCPLQAPSKYINPFFYIKDEDRKKFAGIVCALDVSVGEVLAALDEARVLNNTIIIFTSDNGASVEGYMNGTGSNFPLRGAKFTLWEGGTRVPAWIWSAELRKKSRVLDDFMHISDWLPTLYAAAGGNVNNLKSLDGFNQWPIILGGRSSLRQEILYNIDSVNRNAAIRKRQFKLVVIGNLTRHLDTWFDQSGKKVLEEERESYLYNFLDDTDENDNLLYLHSLASRILLKNYGIGIIQKLSSPKSKKLIIDCQLNDTISRKKCKLTEEPCLFDISKDPCEYNNIAEENPHIVKELQYLLAAYQKKSVPPRNQPSDPMANPKYHNNTYASWRST